MLGKLPSARFTAIYDSLPPDAQKALIEKQLIPLLNHVDKSHWKKAVGQATNLQQRHAGIPILDLRAKRLEVNALLDELHRDSKRSFVKERSNKKELISETVDSLTGWLNDIWSVVYEHNVDFMHAHKCLLFVAGTLDHMISGRTGCKCAFTNLFVNVTLKNKSGKRVKAWDISGAHNVEEVLHFIWREIFLSMLAMDNKKQIREIPNMLEEIEDLLGWTALERILYGGKKCPHDIDPEDEDDEESFDEIFGNEEGSEFFDDDDMPIGPQHARHWSFRISSCMPSLRDHIHTALMAIYKQRPSSQLYQALCTVSNDSETTQTELLDYLQTVATSCSESFAVALDIYALEDVSEAIVNLLRTHSHLLRPRDASSLQAAVTIIGQDPFHQQDALQIIEKELLDTVRGLRAALLVSFSQLEQPAHKTEVANILRMHQGAAGRQDRIEAWVDAVSTPGTNAPNPVAFAAMMMGLPLVPGMDPSEDADPLGYLDLDPNDPDLEDLREEFRPRMKARFEGWAEVAAMVKGGPMTLLKVCKEIMEMMPWIRASDVVDEMVGRLADKPSKHHVCDALDSLMHFVKQQRKKASGIRAALRRKEGTVEGGSSLVPPVGPTNWSNPLPHPIVDTPSASAATPPTGLATPATTPDVALPDIPALVSGIFQGPRFGGMEDVD